MSKKGKGGKEITNQFTVQENPLPEQETLQVGIGYDVFMDETQINNNVNIWLNQFKTYNNVIDKNRSPPVLISLNDTTNVSPTVSINLRVVLSLIIDKCHDFIETPQFVSKNYWKYSVLFIIQVNYPTYIYYDTGKYKDVFTNLIVRIISMLVESSSINKFLGMTQKLYDNFEDFIPINNNNQDNQNQEEDNQNEQDFISSPDDNSLKSQYSSYKKSLCYSISGNKTEQYLKPIEANPYSLYDSKYLVDTNIGTETTYCNVFNMLLTNDKFADKAYVFSTIDAVNAESSSDTLGLLAYRNICENMIPLNTLANKVDASQKSPGFENMNSLIKKDAISGNMTGKASEVVSQAIRITKQEIKLVDMTSQSTLFFTTTIERVDGKEITIEETRKVISDLVELLLNSNNGDPTEALNKLNDQMQTDNNTLLSYFSENAKYNTFCHNFRTVLHNDFTNYDNNETPIYDDISNNNNLSTKKNIYLPKPKEPLPKETVDSGKRDTRSSKNQSIDNPSSNENKSSPPLFMEDYFNVLSNHGKRNIYSDGRHFPNDYTVNNFYQIEECFNNWFEKFRSNNINLCRTLFYLSFILFPVTSPNTQGSDTNTSTPNKLEDSQQGDSQFSIDRSPQAKNKLTRYEVEFRNENSIQIFTAILTEAANSINRLDEKDDFQDKDDLKDKLKPIKFKEIIKQKPTESEKEKTENDSDVVISTKITYGSELLGFNELLIELVNLNSNIQSKNPDTYATVKTYGSTKNPSVANISQRIRDIIHMYYGESIEDNVKTNRKTGASIKTQDIMLKLFHKFLFGNPTDYNEFILLCKLIQSVMEQKTMCDISQSLCSVFVNEYPMLENGFASLLTFDTAAACVMREVWQIEQNYHLNISFIFTKPTPFIFPPNSFIPLFNALSYRKGRLNEGISVSPSIQSILYFWKGLLNRNDDKKDGFIDFISYAYSNPDASGDYLLQQPEPRTPPRLSTFPEDGSEGSQETYDSYSSYETALDSKNNNVYIPSPQAIQNNSGVERRLDATATVRGSPTLVNMIDQFVGSTNSQINNDDETVMSQDSNAGGSRKHHRTPHNSAVTRRKTTKSSKRKTIKKRKMLKRNNKTRRN